MGDRHKNFDDLINQTENIKETRFFFYLLFQMIKFTVHDNFSDNKYPLPSLPWHTATGLKSATENLRLA